MRECYHNAESNTILLTHNLKKLKNCVSNWIKWEKIKDNKFINYLRAFGEIPGSKRKTEEKVGKRKKKIRWENSPRSSLKRRRIVLW